MSSLSYWMHSKGRIRLDTGRKGQSLQDGCRLFAWTFFFQTQQQGHEQDEEPLSAYVVMSLWLSSNPVQMSMLCRDLRQPFWFTISFVWN
ncbi:hypothetical protein TNCV_4962411 [Trichonephila clavipes]|nr:hypothetical protein TNCV_4962411 [Trichonephila clavipes]